MFCTFRECGIDAPFLVVTPEGIGRAVCFGHATWLKARATRHNLNISFISVQRARNEFYGIIDREEWARRTRPHPWTPR